LTVARTRGLLDGVGHRLDDDLLVDRLLARDSIRDLQKLQPVCTDYHVGLLGQLRRLSAGCSSQFALSSSSCASASSASRCFSASLSRRNASAIRSSVRTSLASAIASHGMVTFGSSP